MALKHRLTGSLHGVADFSLNTYHGFSQFLVQFSTALTNALPSFAVSDPLSFIHGSSMSTQNSLMHMISPQVDRAMQKVFPGNLDSQVFNHFKATTPTALHIASIGMGAVSLAGKATNLLKFSNPKTVGMFANEQRVYSGFAGLKPGAINPSKGIQLNRFHQAARNLSLEGKNNIRILRGWAKSKGWEKFPNSNGAPERWGTFRNGEFQWNLRIKPEASSRLDLHQGSNMPRFDARLSKGGNSYINPFTNETGGKSIGTHIPLELLFKQ